MKCPKCRRENPEDASFCNGCAHPLQTPEQTSRIDFTRPHSYTPKFLADKILTTRSAMEGWAPGRVYPEHILKSANACWNPAVNTKT